MNRYRFGCLLSLRQAELIRVGDPLHASHRFVLYSSRVDARLDALAWALWSLMLQAGTRSVAAKLASMTPAERDAYFAQQNALITRIFQL